MPDDLTIPDFLDRKKNPVSYERNPTWQHKKRSDLDIALEGAWSEAEKDAIRERFALKIEIAKEAKKQSKRLVQNGHKIYLAQPLENSPLKPGEHIVELVKKGRKWVRFRCVGRKNCVKVRRVIWDAINQGETT